MSGVLGAEFSDLGLEIIELLSRGDSGIDGLDWSMVCATKRDSMLYTQHHLETRFVENPLAIGIWTRTDNEPSLSPSYDCFSMYSKQFRSSVQ